MPKMNGRIQRLDNTKDIAEIYTDTHLSTKISLKISCFCLFFSKSPTAYLEARPPFIWVEKIQKHPGLSDIKALCHPPVEVPESPKGDKTTTTARSPFGVLTSPDVFGCFEVGKGENERRRKLETRLSNVIGDPNELCHSNLYMYICIHTFILEKLYFSPMKLPPAGPCPLSTMKWTPMARRRDSFQRLSAVPVVKSEHGEDKCARS